METGDKSILLRIYQEKVQEKVLKDSELEALKQFIDDGDADKANEALDYQTVENAIESLLPGKEWGDYFKSHFKPFLNVRLKTLEQKQALHNILEYCDETTLKVPFIMGIGAKMIGGIAQETRTADDMILNYYRQRTGIVNPFLDLKNITISPTQQKWAEDALQHTFFVHNGYQPSYNYGKDINWQYWPIRDNELRWQLHRHKWFTPMGKVYWLTKDEKYTKEFLHEMTEWGKAWPVGPFMENEEDAAAKYKFPGHSWRTIETAMRIYTVWLPCMEAFRTSPVWDREP